MKILSGRLNSFFFEEALCCFFWVYISGLIRVVAGLPIVEIDHS